MELAAWRRKHLFTFQPGSGPAPAVDDTFAAELNAAARGQGVPDAVNWVTRGGVTAVGAQGMCGTIAFAITGTVEGVNFAMNHRLVSLSAQEVLACSTPDGCNWGGYPSDSLHWFASNTNGWICTNASDPYESFDGVSPSTCALNCTKGTRFDAVVNLPHSEAAIEQAVAINGPVAVMLDATSWCGYDGGVFDRCTFESLTHAVTVVGYNNTHRPPYWLVKNSWGSGFGENGYIRIEKGTNQCGINKMPTTVRIRR